MQSLLKFKKALKSSILFNLIEEWRFLKLNKTHRALTAEEIEILKANGNSAEDWSLIQVEKKFNPHRVLNSRFLGTVYLPAFTDTLLLPGDVSHPTGIYDSSIHNSFIENAVVYRVSMLSNNWVRLGAVLQNIGSLVSNGPFRVQWGTDLVLGNEMGARPIFIFPEIEEKLIQIQLTHKKDEILLTAYEEAILEWKKEAALLGGVVDKGAVIANTNIVRNSWIGPYARFEGAANLRACVVLSSLESSPKIYDAVILENTNLQEGAVVHSGALVKDSLLMKHSKVGNKAIIKSSVIAPLATIEEGEVSSSYVAALTQMHHHSLLISALCFDGGLNLGYGANVGSNHTGRMPDQELYASAALFFGLGVNIKYPANFTEAPFTVIATGVTSEAQRLSFPFSLILSGVSKESRLNELVPAWTYGKNAYAIARNFYKYKKRSKGLVLPGLTTLWQTSIAKNVHSAYQKLQVKEIKEVYYDSDIPGIGSNYLKEVSRKNAILHYENYLKRYLLRVLLEQLEKGDSTKWNSPKFTTNFEKQVFKNLYKDESLDPQSVEKLLKQLRTLEKSWLKSIELGAQRDTKRGTAVFDDYEDFHPLDFDFLANEKQNYEQIHQRISAQLNSQILT